MPVFVGGENRQFPKNCEDNSKHGILQRLGGILLCKCIHVTANNEYKKMNILEFKGTIGVIAQYAEIIEVTSCSNMTSVYLDIWDGINSELLTKNTADFSGLEKGSFFSKLGINTEEYVLHISDQCRHTELKADDLGQPFIITAKNEAKKYKEGNRLKKQSGSYIRFNFTTNTILDFKMIMYFNYIKLNSSLLKFI